MIEFTIPVCPVTKKNHSQIIAKTGRHTGKGQVIYVKGKNGASIPVTLYIVPSPQYQKYERACKKYIPAENIDYPVNVKAVFYMETRRAVDITNLHQALHDILKKYGCVKDDNCNFIYSTDGSYVAYDKQNPRTEVTITKLDGVTVLRDQK